MNDRVFAEKRFELEDQRSFAALSGDRNPIHLDPVFARRTEMGAPIVHGIHALLWALEALLRSESIVLDNIGAEFVAPIYVGDLVKAQIARRSPSETDIALSVERAPAVKISLRREKRRQQSGQRDTLYEKDWPVEPVAAELETLHDQAGAYSSAGGAPEGLGDRFPAACGKLSPQGVASLCAISRLVGMACPGLYSLLKDLDVDLVETPPDKPFEFAAGDVNARFRVVRMSVSAPGLFGTVSAFSRHPPVSQPSFGEIAAQVPQGAFAGADVFVVGGSRGLGEVIAKMCAAGGARLLLSYASGIAEADAIAREIREQNGTCEILPLDMLAGTSGQLRGIPFEPTHLYYCASPPMLHRSALSAATADHFRFFAGGFFELCNALLARPRTEKLRAFYPSLANPVRGTTDWAMAKAAGEILCDHMNRFMPGIEIVCRRLPRLRTDQSATVIPVRTKPMLEVVTSLVREVQEAN